MRRVTFSTFQIRIVVSSEAEARYLLSPDQAMSDNPCVCPTKFFMNWPVSGDHILTTFSAPVENLRASNIFKHSNWCDSYHMKQAISHLG